MKLAIEICDIYVGMFTIIYYVVTKQIRMPNETIIAKETKNNNKKRCTHYCSNAGSSASLALIASYLLLNARLDVLSSGLISCS